MRHVHAPRAAAFALQVPASVSKYAEAKYPHRFRAADKVEGTILQIFMQHFAEVRRLGEPANEQNVLPVIITVGMSENRNISTDLALFGCTVQEAEHTFLDRPENCSKHLLDDSAGEVHQL